MAGGPAHAAPADLHVAGVETGDTAGLCLARVRLRAAMRAAWLHDLWRRDTAGDPSGLARIAEDRDRPDAEARWRAADPGLASLRAGLEAVEGALATDTGSPLAHLREIFGIDAASIDLVHLTFAHALDEGLAPVLRHLSADADVAYPTPWLAARLFPESLDAGREPPWRSDSPLARWRLVQREGADPATARLSIDEGIRAWLAGGALGDGALAGIVHAAAAPEPLAHWPVDEVAGDLERLVQREPRHAARVEVLGVAGIGRRSFAAAVARRLGLGLVVADAAAVAPGSAEEIAVRVHRHAFLNGAAIAWRTDGAPVPALPGDLVPFPVEFVLAAPGRAAGAGHGHPHARADAGRATLQVHLTTPGSETRLRLWRAHLPESAAWDREALVDLATRHRASPGRIAAAAAQCPASPEAAGELVSRLDRHRFANLAERVPCPFVRDDLVLPARVTGQLDTLTYEARCRVRFWERAAARRLFPRGRGLTALLTGPPGTGKTMAAQVLARELALDLFRVDLSSVVSKYVGETAENIERILAEAAATDVVLLFDEADGLFAKRTDVSDAHDRYANTDTGHLLQAIECHDGIVLLASNRRRNIDEAFLRRLRYVLEFPPPDDEARLTIWQRVVGELCGADATVALAPVLERLAHRVNMTGAQIKHAVLTAVFRAERVAEPLAPPHLLAGIDAELMKEGRALSDRDRAQLGRAS